MEPNSVRTEFTDENGSRLKEVREFHLSLDKWNGYGRSKGGL